MTLIWESYKNNRDGFCVAASDNVGLAVGRSVWVTSHQSPSSGAAKGGHDGAYRRISAWRLRRYQRACLAARHQAARHRRHGDHTGPTWPASASPASGWSARVPSLAACMARPAREFLDTEQCVALANHDDLFSCQVERPETPYVMNRSDAAMQAAPVWDAKAA